MGKIESLEAQQRAQQMRRRRQDASLEYIDRPAWPHEIQAVMEANLVVHSATAVEVQQVGEAAQQYVLAVVDVVRVFVRRIEGERSGAAPQKRTRFVQIDFETNRAQRSGGGETGESSADDDYAGNGGAPPVRRIFSARATIHSFSIVLRLARRVWTS